MTDTIGPMPQQIDQQQLAQELVERARAEGVDLVGPGGLLTGLTKTVLETALEAEMSEHLGYDKFDPAGRNGRTRGTGRGRRRCSPRSGRCRSRSPATGTAPSTR
jgi:transposase-like protein